VNEKTHSCEDGNLRETMIKVHNVIQKLAFLISVLKSVALLATARVQIEEVQWVIRLTRKV